MCGKARRGPHLGLEGGEDGAALVEEVHSGAVQRLLGRVARLGEPEPLQHVLHGGAVHQQRQERHARRVEEHLCQVFFLHKVFRVTVTAMSNSLFDRFFFSFHFSNAACAWQRTVAEDLGLALGVASEGLVDDEAQREADGAPEPPVDRGRAVPPVELVGPAAQDGPKEREHQGPHLSRGQSGDEGAGGGTLRENQGSEAGGMPRGLAACCHENNATETA